MEAVEEAPNFCPCSSLLHLVSIFGSNILGFVQNLASALSVCLLSSSLLEVLFLVEETFGF